VTYRLSIHTTADDPNKYRDQEEVQRWEEQRDPLPHFQNYLIEHELLSEDDAETMDSEIKEQVKQAWQDAADRIDELEGPQMIFDHIYDERSAYLEAQREAFIQARQD